MRPLVNIIHEADTNRVGQQRMILVPHAKVAGRCGILYHHGSDTIIKGMLGSSQMQQHLTALCAASGMVIVCHDFSYNDGTGTPNPNAWGNAYDLNTMNYELAVTMDRFGCRTDQAFIVGTSQGGTPLLNFALNWPDRVAGCIFEACGLDQELWHYAGTPKDDMNLAYGLPLGTVGQYDADGSVTGHPGWYYGTSLTFQAGLPLTGRPICGLDPRNIDDFKTKIVDAGKPVMWIYSSADTTVITTYAGSNGVVNATYASWCPAVGVDPTLCSDTAEHPGTTLPGGGKDSSQILAWPAGDIGSLLSLRDSELPAQVPKAITPPAQLIGANDANSVTTLTTTVSANVPIDSTIIVTVKTAAGTDPAGVTDSANNTYKLIATTSQTTGSQTSLYMARAATALRSGIDTVTANAAVAATLIFDVYFASGLMDPTYPNALDIPVVSAVATSGTTITPPATAATVHANALALLVFSAGAADTGLTLNESGWTLLASDTTKQMFVWYKVLSSAGQVMHPTVTYPVAGNSSALLAVLRAA